MPTDWQIIPPTDPRWTEADPADREWATKLAGELLQARVSIFGLHEAAVRPCLQPKERNTYRGTGGVPSGMAWTPGVALGQYGTAGTCGCGSPNCCVGAHEVWLPGPVHSVVEVKVDGVVLPSAAYRVRNQRWLLRVDGQPWPKHQDLDRLDDEPGTWLVRYMRGIEVPLAGQAAAGALALELLLARTGGPCALPQRVTSVTRQGMSVELADLQAMFEHGAFGIPLVDQWLAIVNPNGLQGDPTVWSPDGPRAAVIQ